MLLDQEQNVVANNIHTKECSSFESSPPYLFADYYDARKGYLLDSLDSKDFIVLNDIAPEADSRLIGQAVNSVDTGFIALYSIHKQKIEDSYVPKFSISCFLRVDAKTFDLRNKKIIIKWRNGFIRRKFQVLEECKILYDYSYFRPWYYELFKGTHDQNLHGIYDFFSYVAWASKR